MARSRLLLVDNIDSFSFMLADTLIVAGADLDIVRNDEVTLDEALSRGRDGIVVSPGPGAPRDAGISVALAAAAVAANRPFLGVCLGHQALTLACGGTIDRVAPMHGKIARVSHDGSGLFAGLSSPLEFTRYHSLAATSLPDTLVPQAWSEDGVVMAVRHTQARLTASSSTPKASPAEQGPPSSPPSSHSVATLDENVFVAYTFYIRSELRGRSHVDRQAA